MPITDINQLDMDATYTVADYLSWQFEEMVQLIKGKIVRMSPAPRKIHFKRSFGVIRSLDRQIPSKGPCGIYFAPFDVYLPTKDGGKATVVQPDILIVCDPAKITERGCQGAPDWVCEIVSPGSVQMDAQIKKDLYEEAGVLEYCLIFPGEQAMQVYRLGPDGRYGEADFYERPEQVYNLASVPSVALRWEDIFEE